MEILTTTTKVDAAVGIYYDRKLLLRAKPYLIHMQYGQQRPLPAKSGTTVKFRSYLKMATANVPLTEGITPAGMPVEKSDRTVQVKPYGSWTSITDMVELTVEDNVLNEATDILAEQYGETLDELTRDILAACASSTNATHGSNGQTPTELHKDDIDAIVKVLVVNDAEMLAPVVLPGSGVATSPLPPCYRALMHADLVDDLERCTNFQSFETYSKQQGIDIGEWGRVGRVRFSLSSKGHKNTTPTPDQYKVIILARNAYGIVRHKTGDVQTIYHDRKIAGGPLEQCATLGWKTMFAARILNDNFMHVLNVTHS